MASLIQLESAVLRLLRAVRTTGVLQLNNRSRERAFEAYVFSLCLEAVRRLNGTVEIRGILSGPNPNPIVFRGAPGVIYSQVQDFAYAFCTLNGKEFEIHVDVEFIGQSTASHEIDVSIIDHNSAERCRARLEYPRMSQYLIGAIECKFYSGNPGVTLARTFAGLVSDASTNRIEAFVFNRFSVEIAAFFSKVNSASCFENLSPLNPTDEEMFVNYIMNELRKWSRRKN
ncbi:hypothetical protein Dalu01_03350 [Deinococcus aluminii]|uniref:Restriction endonuclease n=1 Tax=Deinococcus aluminii TaxID=1656885 RepID=A0ABP9XHW9_9DEIO